MKKLGFFILLLFCISFSAYSQLKAVPYKEAKKMIKKYDKKFGNHTRTDGVILKLGSLENLLAKIKLDSLAKTTDNIAIVYARYYKKSQWTDEFGKLKGKKRRTTFLLMLPSPGPEKTNGTVYFDLGALGSLCPEPPNCGE